MNRSDGVFMTSRKPAPVSVQIVRPVVGAERNEARDPNQCGADEEAGRVGSERGVDADKGDE